ncbi:MAG: hypothetical protein Q4Q53_04595 [Methanocorpusculum sp.]|nr:hypothetical protein [Methanocorpusculum sp.]
MILIDAVKKMKNIAEGMGTEDGDLIFASLPDNHVCQFCSGKCMGAEFGGHVAEISTPEPFTAKMRLENLFDAPLKSVKTKYAAAGAITTVSGFLMLTRKTAVCSDVMFEDCLAELVDFCKGKDVYIIGKDIAGISQTLTSDEADLILISGDAFSEDSSVEEIDEVIASGKDVLFVGPNCTGIAAVLQKPSWCPYGT